MNNTSQALSKQALSNKMFRSVRHSLLLLSLLVLVLVLLLPGYARAAGQPTSFVLVAETEKELLIAPEWVTADAEATIGEALQASGHSFEGLSKGFITAVDGIIYQPNRGSDTGVYDFEESASAIGVLRFSPSMDNPGSGLCELLYAMADYNASVEAQDDEDTTAIYAAALNAYIGITDARAKELAGDLRAALDGLKNAARYELVFDVKQNGKKITDYTVSVKSNKGSVLPPDGSGRYFLRAGDYTVEINRGYNAVYGEFTLSADSRVLSVELPWADAFNIGPVSVVGNDNQEYRSLTPNGLMSVDFSPSVHEYTIVVPDNERHVRVLNKNLLGIGDCYAYYADLEKRIHYTGVFGTGTVLSIKYENSPGIGLGLLDLYGSGCRYRLTNERALANGFTQIQSYYINVIRERSLSEVIVSDAVGNLPVTVDETGKKLSVTVSPDCSSVQLQPVAAASAEQGYSVLVNSKPCAEGASVSVALTGAATKVPIRVAHTDGSYTDYQLTVNKGKTADTHIAVTNSDATLTVTNAVGTEIPAGRDGSFKLLEGQSYTVAAGKQSNSASYTFTASAARPEVSLTLPETYNWLSNVRFFDLEDTSSEEYLLTAAFDPEVHEYVAAVPEECFRISALVSLNHSVGLPADVKIMATYRDLGSAVATDDRTRHTELKDGVNTLLDRVAAGRVVMPVQIDISYTRDNVTYTQTYNFGWTAPVTMTKLDCTADGSKLAVEQLSDDMYQITVSELAKNIDIVLNGVNTLRYEYYVDGVRAESRGQDFAATVRLADIKDDTVTLRVYNPFYDVESLYYLKVVKVPALKVKFDIDPADAVVFLTDSFGDRIYPEKDGSFKLLKGETYDFTVNREGYLSESRSLKVTRATTYVLTMRKARLNLSIDFDMPAAWATFRGDKSNNAVVDARTPTNADNAMLYWATQCGSGYGSQAISPPLLVNDYLVCTAGKTIYRMNRFTGEVDQEVQGTMVTSSAFNITPPAYADGVLYVALAGGIIQAFNADTFESLWVYRDPLGGQPNCPLVIHNGYVYTGFWQGEEKYASFVCVSVTDEKIDDPQEQKQAVWRHKQLGGFYWAGAYVCDDFVLVGTDDMDSGCSSPTSVLLSLDPKTGEVLDSITGLNGDIRSSVCYDEVTDRYYFTTKGGSFYSVAMEADGTIRKDADGLKGYDLKEIKLYNYSDGSIPMSTCTPVVHNGRAYIGVSGAGQFSNYSGHNLTVIDLENWRIAYTVRTKGYPQTSGLLTSAYESEDGYAYIYFIDNTHPGQVRVIKDKPGVNKPIEPAYEAVMSAGKRIEYACAPVLFTPAGAQAQYAICSPIVDEYGTLYFKNDSAYMMAVGSRITAIEVVQQPDKTVYKVGEKFDPTGMVVVAKLANGCERDITDQVTFLDKPFTAADTDITIYYPVVKYYDEFNPYGGNKTNIAAIPPETYVNVTVTD